MRDIKHAIRLVEKCPRCELTYTVFLNKNEKTQYVIGRLRDVLPKACPDHAPSHDSISVEGFWTKNVA